MVLDILDRILEGEKPVIFPHSPTRFELVANLTVAEANAWAALL